MLKIVSILGLYLKLKFFWKSRDVTKAESYIISALVSCNFIIKNYVNRKITSYTGIYLLIFTRSLWLHVKHFIALTKRERVRRIFFVITDPTLVNTLSSDHEKHGKVQQHWRQKYIKRVRSDSYLTYSQSCKKLYVYVIR